MLSNIQVIIRLVLSLILGGFIGIERQLHRRTAGLRTHILVSLGSCLIMLTSIYIFAIYKNEASLDPARIAAGVITGIGFLGA
ncbi:MAG: MgtC/SapB family protein, partial [Candidatus Omnitrophota bacterium]